MSSLPRRPGRHANPRYRYGVDEDGAVTLDALLDEVIEDVVSAGRRNGTAPTERVLAVLRDIAERRRRDFAAWLERGGVR